MSTGFLTRWSRLKHATQAAPEPSAAENAQAPLSARRSADDATCHQPARIPAAGEQAQQSLVPPGDDAMPALESLDNDADFSPFLSDGVSDALRRKALRKLFHSPQFNVRDGLNDYDDDFTEMAPLGNTLTYQMKRWLAGEAELKPDQAGSGSGTEAQTDQLAPSSQEAKASVGADKEMRPADRAEQATRQPADRAGEAQQG